MTDEQTALSRRVVACKGWRWMPGMMRLRATPPSLRDHLLREGRAPDGGDTWEYAAWPVIPDLTDAATVGCLLALVREAHGQSTLSPVSRGLRCWCLADYGTTALEGETEIELLVLALESAP